MSFHLIVRPEVDRDILEAEAWYNQHQPGVGFEFTRMIRDEIRGLSLKPLLHGLRHRALGVRWLIPKRFPYRIIFRIEEDTVVVFAVLHAARHDREWKKRF